jgi:site-specific DNA recombinase
MQNLLTRIKDFDIVLVFRLDRISRRTKNTLHLVEDIFLKNNIDFISIQESFDTTTPQGRLFLQQLASFAQYERDCITERMQSGRKARAQRGLYHGSGYSPTGYDYIDGKLIINEYESLQVKEVFTLYLKGVSINQISKKMQKTGYIHKHGDWRHCKTVKAILTNVIYTGKMSYSGNIYQALHAPIISEEVFNAAQVILREREKNKHKVYVTNSLLTGFLYCGYCGGRFCKTVSISKKIYRYNYYICYSRHKKIPHMIKDPNCRSKLWKVEQLDAIIEREITKKFSITPKKKEKKEDKSSKKDIIEKKIAEIERKINKLLDLYQVDGLAINEITEKIKKLHEEKIALYERMLKEKDEMMARLEKLLGK